MTLLRQVLAPDLSALAFVAVLIVYGARHPVPRPPRPSPLTLRRLASFLRHLAVLAVGGYAVLLAVVLVFGVLIVGDDGSLRDAAAGGAFLLVVATPVFVLLQWVSGSRG